jgi:hypothetical protein
VDTQRIAKYQRWLESQYPLISPWLRWWAVQRLVREGSATAVRVLAQAVTRCDDERGQQTMLQALQPLVDRRCIDEVCAMWATTRHTGLASLLAQQGWVASAPAPVKVLSALQSQQLEVVMTGGVEVVEPLLHACTDVDLALAERARFCALRLQGVEVIDALCALWAKEREGALADIITQAGYVAQKPLTLRVLSALQVGRFENISVDGVEIVEPLLQACEDREPIIAERARQVLQQQLQHPEMRQALCRLVFDHDSPIAREVARTIQFAPHDVQQRALFYFLTEQWDKYESLDFDLSLLRAAYATGDAWLRGRITAHARRAGRVEWVEVATGGQRTQGREAMTDEEWEAVLAVLEKRERWEELWGLAQEASPWWSARVVQRLAVAGWMPENAGEREEFSEFRRLAERCEGVGIELSWLIQPGATLQGHTSWINALAISPDGRILASGSLDRTVRLWGLPGGRVLTTLRGHTASIESLAMSPDGRVVASGGWDHTVRLWSLPEGRLLTTLQGHAAPVESLAMSPDGQILASGGRDSTVLLWNLTARRLLTSLKGHVETIGGLSISPDGRVLVSGSKDRTIRLWSLPDGRLLTTLQNPGWVKGLAIRGYPETFSLHRRKIMQHPCGNETQGDRKEQVDSA